MTPFELFEKTMRIIDTKEDKRLAEDQDIVQKIKKLIDDENLPVACETLHNFILDDTHKDCFEKNFPISYAFDQTKINTRVKLGYGPCYNENDKPARICDSICCGCACYKASKDGMYKYKNELDHFLTRLLFESRNSLEHAFGDKKGKDGWIVKKATEPGLFILASEVLAKEKNSGIAKNCLDEYANNVKAVAEKSFDPIKEQL